MSKNDVFNQDSLFESMANISKAHAYDVLVYQVQELKQQNKDFRTALRSVVNEIAHMNPAEVIKEPSLLVGVISNICSEILSKNRPL